MVEKRVAILQSNYIPWKGYFDVIAAVDEFILYDDMQYTRRDWRNRNKIKTPQGLQWLTVPVSVKGKYHQAIREVEIKVSDWAADHWKSIILNYRRAPYFDEIASIFEPLYMEKRYTHLSQLNRTMIEAVCAYLGIATKISNSSDYELVEGKTERLVALCEQAKASVYVSGPAARDYVVEELFAEKGIGLQWFDYSGYSEYSQLWGEFEHAVTVLDVLFNCGTDSMHYMRSIR